MPSGSSFILLSERSEARLKKLSRWKYSKMQNTADCVGALQKKNDILAQEPSSETLLLLAELVLTRRLLFIQRQLLRTN